jgi:hypothetical protein
VILIHRDFNNGISAAATLVTLLDSVSTVIYVLVPDRFDLLHGVRNIHILVVDIDLDANVDVL